MDAVRNLTRSFSNNKSWWSGAAINASRESGHCHSWFDEESDCMVAFMVQIYLVEGTYLCIVQLHSGHESIAETTITQPEILALQITSRGAISLVPSTITPPLSPGVTEPNRSALRLH